jgi:hypothetical protein
MKNIYTSLKTKNNSSASTTNAQININKHKKTVENYLKDAGINISAKDFVYDINKNLLGVFKISGDVYIFSEEEIKKLEKLGVK